MGGPSSEREVSLRSGAAVAAGLRAAGYEVLEVDVKSGDLNLPGGVEAVFIALHGAFGEDGTVQALLEKMRIPYTGSGPEASRRSFDKILSKKVFVGSGIPTPGYEILKKGMKRRMSLPLVVKPVCQGSSVGVNRVLTEPEWDAAAADTWSFGEELLAEQYIPGRELTVGILGDKALPIVEIVAPGGWYDYKAKYTKGASRYLVPAEVDARVAGLCQESALKAFRVLGCSDFARVDIRMSPENEIYVLELNNIPGFTETSLLPKAAANAGIVFAELCDRIMSMADL
ncbi:MAG: D-alanine--D-alanine ligase [Verrucomicrobia bacterium]|nr:D-alanine--D-alanine ligase [Verrucomicrobiota bacterium]